MLKNGLEILRGIGSAKADGYIALELAKFFAKRCDETCDPNKRILLNERGKTLFQCALKIINMKTVHSSQAHNLFEYETTNNDIPIECKDALDFLANKYGSLAVSYSDMMDCDSDFILMPAQVNYDRESELFRMQIENIQTFEHDLFCTLTHPLNANSTSTESHSSRAIDLMFELDQALYVIASTCETVPEFLEHFGAQLTLHAATLVFRIEAEKKDPNWAKTVQMTLPLLFSAHSFNSTGNNEKSSLESTEKSKEIIDSWEVLGHFRALQVTYTIRSFISNNVSTSNAVLSNWRQIFAEKYIDWRDSNDVIKNLYSIISNSEWKTTLYNYLFNNHSGALEAISSSFLISTKILDELGSKQWPDMNELNKFEQISLRADPSNLTHLVYLALNRDRIENFKCDAFENIEFATKDEKKLCQLDLDAFLYAVVIQAEAKIDSHIPNSVNRPKMLPYANMMPILCTEEQNSWWSTAYNAS